MKYETVTTIDELLERVQAVYQHQADGRGIRLEVRGTSTFKIYYEDRDPKMAARIANAIAGTQGVVLLGQRADLLDEPGEELAPLGVLPPLAVLDVRPLGMASHNTTPNARTPW